MNPSAENFSLNIRELQAGRNILHSLPSLVYIELTERCNCTCRICYRQTMDISQLNDPGKDIKKSTYERIAGELFPTAQLVDLRGFGETTIYPYFVDILEYNKKYFPHLHYKLISNGKRLPPAMMTKMLDLDLALYISFDAAEKSLFEYLRQGNRFDVVVKHIETWNQLNRPGNKVRLLVTLHHYNVHQLADIAHFAVKSGCQLVSISDIDAPPGSDWLPDRHACLSSLAQCLNICADAGLDMVLPSHYYQELPLREKPGWKIVGLDFCSAPWNSVLLKSNGDVYSCSHRFCSMGNIKSLSFEEIWNGERIRRIRRGVRETSPLLPDSPCHRCTRNDLTYIGTRGIIREKTWQIIEVQQKSVS